MHIKYSYSNKNKKFTFKISSKAPGQKSEIIFLNAHESENVSPLILETSEQKIIKWKASSENSISNISKLNFFFLVNFRLTSFSRRDFFFLNYYVPNFVRFSWTENVCTKIKFSLNKIFFFSRKKKFHCRWYEVLSWKQKIELKREKSILIRFVCNLICST